MTKCDPEEPGCNEHGENSADERMVLIADYVAFACLGVCSIFLHRRIVKFRGPTGEDQYFMGYREEKMLCLLVNLFAAVGYWSRIAARVQGDSSAVSLTSLQYADYLFTCPLVTVDMMWSMNLPYKFTYGITVFVCILSAFACDLMKGQARWMWFIFGFTLFFYVWVSVFKLVRFRFTQLAQLSKQGVLKADLQTPLRVGTGTFFFLWFGYPFMWLLEEFEVLSHAQSEVMHVVTDITVKSIYAVFMQEFCFRCDRTYFDFPSMSLTLTPTEEHAEKNEETKHRLSDERLIEAWEHVPLTETNEQKVPPMRTWLHQGSRKHLLHTGPVLPVTRAHTDPSQRSDLQDLPTVAPVQQHARSEQATEKWEAMRDTNPSLPQPAPPDATGVVAPMSAIPEGEEAGGVIREGSVVIAPAVEIEAEGASAAAEPGPGEGVQAGAEPGERSVEIEETRQEIEAIELAVAGLREKQDSQV